MSVEAPPAPIAAPILTEPNNNILSRTDINPQSTSPLFTILPPEIRFEIYRYALSEYPDTSEGKAYETNSYYVRSTLPGPLTISTTLLLTCLRIYREAKHILENDTIITHIDWLGFPGRAPPTYRGPLKPFQYHSLIAGGGRVSKRLTHATHAQVFAQLYALQANRLLHIPALCTRLRQVTITLRYSDFWHWENGCVPQLCIVGGIGVMEEQYHEQFGWTAYYTLPETVERVVLQMETMDDGENGNMKRGLEMCVKDLVAAQKWWKFVRKDGVKFGLDQKDCIEQETKEGIKLKKGNGKGEVREWKWRGPCEYSLEDHRHRRVPDMGYVVFELSWSPTDERIIEEEKRELDQAEKVHWWESGQGPYYSYEEYDEEDQDEDEGTDEDDDEYEDE